jgi:arylsulfatase A-like enzyme
LALSLALSGIPAMAGADAGKAPVQKPNIILILSDDFGYGDARVYGGGPGRGMPTPSLDRLASEGMTFFSFYAQPSSSEITLQISELVHLEQTATIGAFEGSFHPFPEILCELMYDTCGHGVLKV